MQGKRAQFLYINQFMVRRFKFTMKLSRLKFTSVLKVFVKWLRNVKH